MCSNKRGPAIFPSFVICPISNTAVPDNLEYFNRRAVHSRTWPTLPEAVSISFVYIVWIESITNISGFSFSACKSMLLISDAVMTKRRSVHFPNRPARIAVCSSDSSPDTYKTLTCFWLNLIAASSRMVDFPMPGSPLSRTRLPGTIPPPSTLSNSFIPVSRRRTGFAARLLMVLGFTDSFNPRKPWSLFWTSNCSVREFQLPHSGHLPSQETVTYPQFWHM